MRTITLNPKQQRHVEILTRLEGGALDVATAAELLGLQRTWQMEVRCT